MKKLRGVANGKTEVPMRTQFSAITLHIIGKVLIAQIRSVHLVGGVYSIV